VRLTMASAKAEFQSRDWVDVYSGADWHTWLQAQGY